MTTAPPSPTATVTDPPASPTRRAPTPRRRVRDEPAADVGSTQTDGPTVEALAPAPPVVPLPTAPGPAATAPSSAAAAPMPTATRASSSDESPGPLTVLLPGLAVLAVGLTAGYLRSRALAASSARRGAHRRR